MSDLPAPQITSVARSWRPRGRVRVWIAAGTLLIAVGCGLWWYVARSRSPQPPEITTTDGADPAVVVAVEKARQDVLANPKSAANWGELGMVFGAHGLDPEAEVCLAEAQRLDPVDPRWPYLRGLAATVHAPDRAIPLLKQAIELLKRIKERKSKDTDALFTAKLQLAEILLDGQQADEAEALFREGVAKTPPSPRAQFGLARVALIRGDRKTAREVLTDLAQNPFTRKRAAILLAALSREDSDLAAATGYEESVRLLPEDPPWPDPYLLQLRSREVGLQGILRDAQTLSAAGQHRRAVELLLPLIQDNPNPNPRILVSTGITLGKLREYAQAKELFRECLRREPDHSQAHHFLAVMLFEEASQLDPGEKDKARLLLREATESAAKAVELKPDHGMAWLYLGRARLGLGETRGAIEALQQAVVCRPEFADPHLYLAEALAADGRTDEAIHHARNAEKLARPDDTRPRQLLERLTSKGVSGK